MSADKPASDKNNKVPLKVIVIGVLLFLLTAIGGGAISWYLIARSLLAWSLSASLILALVITIIYVWMAKKNTPKSKEKSQQKLLLQKRKKLLALHFERMIQLQKRKKRLRSRYDQPIYLLLSENVAKDKAIITQMGYEAYKLDDFGNDIEFPILFWLSEHSILISVSQGDDQHPEYISTLCQSLNKYRPRQAVNGLLLATKVGHLLQNQEQISQKADELKSTIKAFNDVFGLNLPIYNLLTNMGSVSDFCQFFSSFDEARRNEPFGATSPYQKRGGIDADWFNSEYDHIISQLIANMSTALSGQLNQEYRNSIACAPYQFGLLKQNLWHFLQRLYRGDQLHDGLQFRGYYFTHSGNDNPDNDILASVVNQTIGNEYYQSLEQVPVQQTLFAQHLMTHVILNEHELVGVNRRKENTLVFNQIAYTLMWLAILAGTLTVIKLDFDYQNSREARADNMLERYKEAISASPYDIENLADNIPNLYSIHQIYALYLKPEPWYTLPFMPSSSIRQEVESAYFSELQRVLIPSMENTLEKDLFVYVNLEDQARTLSLLNNYRLLFSKDRSNIEELKQYFITTLQDQGEADSVNLAQLKVLLDDVFARDLVPEKANSDLESLAKKVINQTGIETLLYDHIQHSSAFAKRIDVRNELGDQFDLVFTFNQGFIGYLVPYLYTPAGFNELDLSVDSAVLKEALQAYEGVAGSSPSALEMYRISRDLKQMYQNDYIAFWRDFTDNLTALPVYDSRTLNSSLSLLTQASDNPLSALFSTVSKYTQVDIPKPDEKEGEMDEAALEAYDSDKAASAKQISLSFDMFHQQVRPNDKGSRPVDATVTLLSNTKVWLDSYYQNNAPEQLAYQTLSATLKADNPVSLLSKHAESQTAVVSQLLNDIAVQSDELVLGLAHQYLNQVWTDEVYTQYKQTIAAFYPFDQSATQEANVSEVKRFFETNGTFDTFYQKRLKVFNSENKSPFLDGLLPDSGLALDPSLWQMVNKAEDIRDALFMSNPNQLSVQFKIKALDMTPDLTEFTISTDKPIFTYRHGPMLWSEQSWKGDLVAQDSLSYTMKAQQTLVSDQSYTGYWNWFRLFEPHVSKTTSTSTQIDINQETSSIRLDVRHQGQVNPFVPGFFAGFYLPESI